MRTELLNKARDFGAGTLVLAAFLTAGGSVAAGVGVANAVDSAPTGNPANTQQVDTQADAFTNYTGGQTTYEAKVNIKPDSVATCIYNGEAYLPTTNTQKVEDPGVPPVEIAQTEITIVNPTDSEVSAVIAVPNAQEATKIECAYAPDPVARRVHPHDIDASTSDAQIDWAITTAQTLVPQPTTYGSVVNEVYVYQEQQPGPVNRLTLDHLDHRQSFALVYTSQAGAQPKQPTPTPSK